MVSSSECNSCIHRDVCAFCDKYKSTVQAISVMVDEADKNIKDINVDVIVKCPHYVLRQNTIIRSAEITGQQKMKGW